MVAVITILVCVVGLLAVAVQVAEPIADGLRAIGDAPSSAHQMPIRASASPAQATDSEVRQVA